MPDRSWDPSPWLPAARARAKRTSHALTMRDGVRIAVDLYVPEGAAHTMPAIVRQTRYLRSLEPRSPLFSPLARAFDLYDRTRRLFLAAGYAWLDVDVRGSGASTGTRPYPWSMPEIEDGAEIASFLVAQPWSNGRVGSLGISYDGTCADMLAVNKHPAVKAVAPLFALYDAYADVAFPGGVHLAWFTDVWARYNGALDRGAFPEAFTPVLRMMARAAAVSPSPRGLEHLVARFGDLDKRRFEALVGGLLDKAISGVRPVDGDRGALLRAIDEHGGNFSVHEGAKKIVFRDDKGLSPAAPEGTIADLSPSSYVDAVRASGAAVYSYTGFRDGGYPRSAVDRYHALSGKLTIGPWVHTGKLRVVPFGTAVPASFDHDAELLAFFDEHLKEGEPRGDGKKVHYYTFVEERWKAASDFPPPFTPKTMFLAGERRLAASVGEAVGHDAHRVDPSMGSGERSRWRSLISLVPGDYPDRKARGARLLAYDSPPLDEATEVTGFPIAALFASWDDDDDGRLFAYLEDVAPDGRVAYVTEGQLRALHRAFTVGRDSAFAGRSMKGERREGERPERGYLRADAKPVRAGGIAELVFEMFPISWLFERGHRVRLTIAGGDADHFQPSRASTLRVYWGKGTPSRVELPVVVARS